MENSNWSSTTKLIVLLTLIAIGVWALVRFSVAIPPLIISFLLAYLLARPTNWLVRHTGLPRGVAIVLVFIGIIFLIILTPVLLAPSFLSILTNFQFDVSSLTEFTDNLKSTAINLGPLSIDLGDVLKQSAAGLQQYLTTYGSQAVMTMLGMLTSLFWSAFIVVTTFWLLKDGYKLENWFFENLPKPYRRNIGLLIKELDIIWGHFFKGILVLAFVMSFLVGVTMWLLGIKNATLLGIFAGFMEFIPSLGPTLGAMLAVMVAFVGGSSRIPLNSWLLALLVLGIYTLLFQIEQVYLYPRVVGRRVHLHPGIVFVGAILGAVEFGLLGVMLAAPTLASLRVIGRYLYRKMIDMDPFPENPKKEAAIQWRGFLRGQPITAILFDLDGTLAETDDHIIEEWTIRLGPLQKFFPDNDARPYIRRWVMQLEPFASWWLTRLDAVDLDDDAFRMVKRIRKLLGYKKTSELTLVAGAEEALHMLHSHYKLGLVTTRDRHSTLRFLEHYQLTSIFEIIITRDEVRRLKPHPEPIFIAAQALDVTTEQCAMVGDTLADIRAARAADAAAIGVLTGFGTEDILEEADLILDSVVELVDWL